MLLLSETIEIDDIVIRHQPSTKARSAELARDIDRIWDEEVAEMTAKGRKIWNAELYRLESFALNGQRLWLDLSTIEVKEIHATHRLPGESELGEKHRPNNIFIASLIETRDGKFIFGRTNANTLNAGRVDLIGGALSKTERPVATSNDLYGSALAEIEEELNLSADRVAHGCLCAILRTPRAYVGLIFLIRLNIDAQEADRLFRARDNDEITEILVLKRAEVQAFLAT